MGLTYIFRKTTVTVNPQVGKTELPPQIKETERKVEEPQTVKGYPTKDTMAAAPENDAAKVQPSTTPQQEQTTSASATTTAEPVASTASQAKKSTLDEIHQKLSLDVDEALKTGNIDFENLQATIFKLAMVTMRLMGQQVRQHNLVRQDSIKEQAEDVRKSHVNKTAITLTILAGTAQVAAGVFGCAQFAPSSVVSEGTAKVLKSAVKPMTAFGSAGQNLASPFSEVQKGVTGEMQTQQSQQQERHSQAETDRQAQKTAAEHMRDLQREHLRQVHEVISSMLG